MRPGGLYPRKELRLGVAAIELAAALPMICLLVFGAMQASRLVQLQHIGKLITDEVVRDATEWDALPSSLITKAESLATAANLKNATASVVESPVIGVVRVELLIPLKDNYIGPTTFASGMSVTAYTSAYKPGI